MMLYTLLAFWLLSIAGLWWTVFVAVHEERGAGRKLGGGETLIGGLVFAMPSTALWAISLYMLVQMSPVYEENLLSKRSLQLWSGWASIWKDVALFAMLLCALYVAASAAVLLSGTRQLRMVAAAAVTSSAVGTLALLAAEPSVRGTGLVATAGETLESVVEERESGRSCVMATASQNYFFLPSPSLRGRGVGGEGARDEWSN